MASRPVTWTGQGLRHAFVGEIVLAVTALLYLLSRSGRLAAFGFILSGVFGVLSIRKMWGGRREFGPDHQRYTNRAFALFWVAALLFAYALVGALSTLPDTLQVRDLYPPVLALAIAFVAETSSGMLLLYHLCGTKRRLWVLGYGIFGAILGIGLLLAGFTVVSYIDDGAGPTLSSAVEANIQLGNFFDTYLPLVMAGFLATRAAAIALVRIARKEVAVAEADAAVEDAKSEPLGRPLPP